VSAYPRNEQIAALPTEALAAYAAVRTVLEAAPLQGLAADPGPSRCPSTLLVRALGELFQERLCFSHDVQRVRVVANRDSSDALRARSLSNSADSADRFERFRRFSDHREWATPSSAPASRARVHSIT
jgi:hypothetical protein